MCAQQLPKEPVTISQGIREQISVMNNLRFVDRVA